MISNLIPTLALTFFMGCCVGGTIAALYLDWVARVTHVVSMTAEQRAAADKVFADVDEAFADVDEAFERMDKNMKAVFTRVADTPR